MQIPIVVSLLVILVAMVPSVGSPSSPPREEVKRKERDESDKANVGYDRVSQARKSSSEADALNLAPAARRRE